jgi:hypothetical protein
MHRLAVRRYLFIFALATGSVATIMWHERARALYPHLVYLTGWALLGLMLVLTAYNLRKKISFFPFLTSRLWLQVHLYLGLFTALVFLLHLRSRAPTGWFELILAGLFIGVTLSGIFGWWLSRELPKRLTTLGGEVPFERIPVLRVALRDEAETLVLSAIPSAKATILADFYALQLSSFFAGPANQGAHLVGSRRPLNMRLAALAEVGRFLNPEEQKTAARLADLVRQKDALDFHRAVQFILKGWLFVHIPLTFGLLLFSFVHVVLVYAFSGGAL